MPRDANVCMCAHMCVCVCVCEWVKHPLRIFVNPLYTVYLSIRRFAFIFAMWGYFSFFFVQMTWRDGKRLIHVFNLSRRSSLKSRGGGGGCWVLMSINFRNFDQNIECSGKH